MAEHRLDAVMIGNSAAALHGAPVTTLDIDFMFRKTPTTLRKLKAVAKSLDASILKPYYPISDLYRVVNDDRGMQLDFMAKLHGIRSFDGLHSRAVSVAFGEQTILIASLADIIKIDPAISRKKFRPVHVSPESKLNVNKKIAMKTTPRKSAKDALRMESDRAVVEQIRRLLALPMNKRTHFLRVRHPAGGSHL
ncbi:MAG: hypothetical protein SH868_16355 [Bythopirellula sp.]|nr:hypothetical protein [Bythopirellula sp.]